MNAKVHTPLTDLQLDGHACMRCGRSFFSDGSLSSPSGHADDGRLLFVCSGNWGCSAADSQPAVTGNPTSADIDVFCDDCGKRLPGWSYRPVFVQCDDCASLDQSPDPDQLVSVVHQRMANAVRQSGQTLPQLAARTGGITLDRLTELLDGRDDVTVSEVLVIGVALGCRAADWFRLDGVDCEVGQ